MKRITVFAIFLSFLFLFSLLLSPVLAQANQNPPTYEKINIDSPLYPFKRLNEKAKLMFIGIFDKSQKIKYMAEISDKRALELRYIIDKQKFYYLEQATSKYTSQLGEISEELDATKSKTDAAIVKNTLTAQVKLLDQVKDKFHSETPPWLFAQQAFETAKVTLSKASELSN